MNGSQEPTGLNPFLSELLKRAKKQVRLLQAVGITTAAEALAMLDAETARLRGAGFLPDAILNARAALGPAKVYCLPGPERPAVPRGELELDIDMESTQEGRVYLWGVNVHDRASTGLEVEGYRPFVTWNTLDEAEEARLFGEFWSWLQDLLGRAASAGRSTRLFVWHAAAENTQLRRIAAGSDIEGEVGAMIGSEAWIDLEEVFSRHWTTGGSTSLKSIAPLSGYTWPVDDPGGARSMVQYELATRLSGTGSNEAQHWLLAYNRGDVEATLRIRSWLDEEGGEWPQVPGA